MPTHRTNDMRCMLCQINKATATGSHFAPAWLIEPTVGERNYEEAVSIDPYNQEIEVFHGRDSLKSIEGMKKKNPHSRDYIFCQQCEVFFAILESEVAPFLTNKIYETKYGSQFDITMFSEEINIKATKKFPASIFHVFVYSVLWRICIQHRLDINESALQANVEERMRYFLVGMLGNTLNDIKKMSFLPPYSYTTITADGIANLDATSVNIDSQVVNPALFFVGKFLILLHLENDVPYSKLSNRILKELNAETFTNSNTDLIKIVFVKYTLWQTGK